MIKLLIKGNEAEAQEAASKHGITLTGIKRPHNECVAECESSNIRAVQSWFNRAPFDAPFKPGTLLFYREF